jgi:hypothetical protein
VSKGAYLTLLKRKSSSVKTLRKHKPISPSFHRKKTTKKILTRSLVRKADKGRKVNQVFLESINGTPFRFSLMDDQDIFRGKSLLPSINMEVDNDEDSSWVQIHENMKILAGSLQAAVRGF